MLNSLRKKNFISMSLFLLLVIFLQSCIALPFVSRKSDTEEVVNVQIRRTRSSTVPYEVELNAFGEDYNLRLKRLSTNPASIFSPTFQIHSVDVNSVGEEVSEYIIPTKEELKSAEADLFVDEKLGVALKIKQVGRGFKVEGMLGSGRSISTNKDGVHKVKMTSTNSSRIPDYIDLHRNLTQIPAMGRALIGSLVQPEVVLIFDNANTLSFGGNVKRITDYISIFFHGVNTRFSALSDPKVSFVLSGMVVMHSRISQPFLERNRIRQSDSCDLEKSLNSFSKWVYENIKSLPKHDLALLITGLDLQSKNIVGLYEKNVNGRAFLTAACLIDDKDKMSMGVAVAEDIGGLYDGTWAVAHELAHNLGAYHDGEGPSSSCSWEDGYLMSYDGWGERNKFQFSACSVKSMKDFFKSTGATCLKSIQSLAKLRIQISADDVGNGLTLQDACIKQSKNKMAIVDPTKTPSELCTRLSCRHPDEDRGVGAYMIIMFAIPPGDGTICQRGKVCRQGECVLDLIPWLG